MISFAWPHLIFWCIYIAIIIGMALRLKRIPTGYGVAGGFAQLGFGAHWIAVTSVLLVINTIAYVIWGIVG